MSFIEKWTDKTKQSIVNAREECDKNKGDEITTVHLLLGILRLGQDPSIQMLTNIGVPINDMTSDLEKNLQKNKREFEFGDIPFTKNAALALHKANDWCTKNKIKHLDPAHILISLLNIKNCSATTIVAKYGVSYEKIIAQFDRPKKSGR